MTDKLNKEKNKHQAKDDSKKEIRLNEIKKVRKKTQIKYFKKKTSY